MMTHVKVQLSVDTASGGDSMGTPTGDPADWPQGEIDLETQDLPHASSSVEWWYFHAHVKDTAGRPFSLFGSFFRIVTGVDQRTRQPRHAHFLTWSLTDVEKKNCLFESRLEKTILPAALERLEKGQGTKDPRIRRALIESLRRGSFPRPDREIEGPVHVGTDRLHLDLGGSTFEKVSPGVYRTHIEGEKAGMDLTFELRKKPQRHGDRGHVVGKEGEAMFYYFVPRTEVTGEVVIGGERFAVTGSGWYDHEFGGHATQDSHMSPTQRDIAWNWLAVQLEDGTDVSLFWMQDIATGKDVGSTVVRVSPEGEAQYSRDFSLAPTRWWTSSRTFEHYPAAGTLKAPALGIDLDLEATVDDQEFITVTSKPSFWEGQGRVTGTLDGKPAKGLAYFERSGHTVNDTLDDFFKAVSRQVRKSVASLLPLHPTREEALDLFADPRHGHLLEGLDEQEIASSLIAPIRTITDRGGKAWRSYAALACCEALGADSRKYLRWLSLPELIHSGSLMVDDVEDRSLVRRGGPTAHVIYGEATAINSGTAAYFLAEGSITEHEDVSDKKKLRLIRLYFEGMRAGHAGQALDIHGFDELVDEAVASGVSGPLERRIAGMYRLKTGAPAGVLARMGVVAADGTVPQEDALGRFFENLGVAFQMVDDVLNLRGFHGKLKNVGEDITSGKVTLPIALALNRLDQSKREWLIETIRSKPEDPAVVRDVIHLLVSVNALDDCLKTADRLVEDSWQEVSPLLPESLHKVMLRAFCWYVLERHY